MVIKDFHSKSVFLDTAPLIYFIEGHSNYQSVLSRLFDFNDQGGFSFVTSSVTLLEVLAKPLREGQKKIADQYRNILITAPGIEMFDVTTSIAEAAASLRATYNLRTPDAIQLATCISVGADFFLTNDNRLKMVSEASVVTIGDIE
ncbi:MAG: type II toxin-antitoxin system VapC family toxin [Ginsengibacter sp.]